MGTRQGWQAGIGRIYNGHASVVTPQGSSMSQARPASDRRLSSAKRPQPSVLPPLWSCPKKMSAHRFPSYPIRKLLSVFDVITVESFAVIFILLKFHSPSLLMKKNGRAARAPGKTICAG